MIRPLRDRSSSASPGKGRRARAAAGTPQEERHDKTTLATWLERQILSGQLAADDQIPSEAELARTFGITRHAVRDQLKWLKEFGLLEGRPGSGTYVSDFTIRTVSDEVFREAADPTRVQVPDHQETLGSAQQVDRWIDVMDAGDAPAEIARAFGLEYGDGVVRRRFLHRHLGKAYSQTTSWIPYALIGDTPVIRSNYLPGPGDPVDALAHVGKYVTHFEIEYCPRLPTEEEMDEDRGLAVSPSIHVSVMQRHTFGGEELLEVGEVVSHLLTRYRQRVDLRPPYANRPTEQLP